MLRYLLSRWLDGFETDNAYDAAYMRDLVRSAPWSFVKFGLGASAPDRRAAPAEALFAASVCATLREDCGPCVQISVDLAARAGLSPDVLRAVIAGDEAAMGETAALAWRFARASLDRDMAACDPLRDEIRRRWGEPALAAIALSMVSGRMFPTLKYALGHGMTCSQVRVAGKILKPLHLAA
jgi:hypothetical protein